MNRLSRRSDSILRGRGSRAAGGKGFGVYGRARKLLLKSGPDVAAFLDERAAFYRRLSDAVAHDRRFLAGWLNRVESLRKLLGIG